MSIAIVVYEGAASSPPLLIVPKPSSLGHIGESPIAVVAVKRVLTEIRTKDIIKTIVIVISDADSTCPSERAQPRFFRDIRKCSIAVVFVQPICCALRSAPEPSSGEQKQIHPPIIVIIDEGAAASGGLDDVLFDFYITIDHRRVQAGRSGNVHEVGVERTPGSSI